MKTRDVTYEIAANCNDVLLFLLVVALKSPRVMESPLLLQADKRARNWFCKWVAIHITPHPASHKNVLQYHSGFTGLLNEVATHFKN